MSQLTSPPTVPTIPGTNAGSDPATTLGALVSGPGQLYFSAPVAGPTRSAAVAAPRRPAPSAGPGQLYFSVPVARPTRSAAVTAPRRSAPLAGHLSSQSRSRKQLGGSGVGPQPHRPRRNTAHIAGRSTN